MLWDRQRVRALFDFRLHKLAVLAELALFSFLIYVVVGTDRLALPEDPEALALTYLGFLFIFSTKGVWMMLRYWRNGEL